MIQNGKTFRTATEWKRRSDYAVALEADEVHRHGDGAIAVPVQSLDVV